MGAGLRTTSKGVGRPPDPKATCAADLSRQPYVQFERRTEASASARLLRPDSVEVPVMGMERRGPITLFSSSGQLSNGEEPGGETQSVAAFRRKVNPEMGRSLGGRQGRRPGDKSRMSREAPVRFREGLGVKLPRA